MPAYSVSTQNTEYSQLVAKELVNFFLRNQIHDQATKPDRNKKSLETSSDLFCIRFRNTSVLFCSSGYETVDGDFERVCVGSLEWLVSPDPFLDAKSLRPLEFRPYRVSGGSRKMPRPQTAGLSLCVIVPIYGSPRYTLDIRNEIEAFLPELDALGGRVIIAIDGHDLPQHTKLHRDLLDGMDSRLVSVHSHKKNKGFIENVNFLFALTSPEELVVLLTSDIKMQPGTLSRLIEPLVESNDIALSTPFAIGGENLEAPDSECINWRDLDTLLSGIEPTYPDAETNVGYLLAIDRRKYTGKTLFDLFFENGYGDDSDLYYRCVNQGLRGVVVDNCCVFHEHGASFSLTQKRAELRSSNHRKFMERWGEVFDARYTDAAKTLEKLKSNRSRLLSALAGSVSAPKIVFLLPTNNRAIGGVAAVTNLVEALGDRGFPAAVISRVMTMDEAGFASRTVHFDDITRRDSLLESASFLIATSHDTVAPVKELANRHGLKTGYFVQGPEFSFSDGHYLRSVITGYSGFDAVFAVSTFLMDLIKDYVEQPVTLIPYGPPRKRYYDLNIPREPNSIAVQLNGNPNKGSAYVAGVIASLAPHGFRFYSFGDEALRGKRQNFCNHLGFLSTSEKIHLFNSVEFYLDGSNYEGLGLLLIEASRCGAIPIYRHNGGTADILKSAGVGIEVGDYAAINKIKHQLTEFRESGTIDLERKRCELAVRDHSLEAAADAILEWWNALH